MGVGRSGFEIGDEVGPVENEDYVAALARFDNGAVGTLANPPVGSVGSLPARHRHLDGL